MSLNRCDAPWWQTATGALLLLFALLAGVVSLSPFWSEDLRRFYDSHGSVGWLSALGIFILAWVVVAVVHHRGQVDLVRQAERHEQEIVQVRQAALEGVTDQARRERDRQQADVLAARDLLGPFLSDGELRDHLEYPPHEKMFSGALSRAVRKTLEAHALGHKPIFDECLSQQIENAIASLTEYWEMLRDVLDTPDHWEAQAYDLEVEQPPGGPWQGEGEEKWNDYNRFLDALCSLRKTFIRKLSPVDKRIYELRVDGGNI